MTLGLDFVPTPTREGFRDDDDDDDDRTRARDEREREREDAASASTRARGRSVNRLAGEMATRAVTGAMRIHACEGRSVRLRKMTTTTMTCLLYTSDAADE